MARDNAPVKSAVARRLPQRQIIGTKNIARSYSYAFVALKPVGCALGRRRTAL